MGVSPISDPKCCIVVLLALALTAMASTCLIELRAGRSSLFSNKVISTSGFWAAVDDSWGVGGHTTGQGPTSAGSIGWSGGSASAGPLHTCTPCMYVGHYYRFGAMTRRLGVMLVRLWPVCSVSAIAVRPPPNRTATQERVIDELLAYAPVLPRPVRPQRLH